MALAEAQSIVQSLHRYSPESAAALEAAVEEQVEQVTYDLDVNMALLKIYQFNPELYNKDVVVNILIKCIMALPQPDFTLCVSMLTEDQIQDDLVQRLQYLCQLLETCHFHVFWTALKEVSEVLDVDEVPGFTKAVRGYIIGILMYSYTRIRGDLLQDFLKLSPAQVQELLAERGWLEAGDGLISLENSLDNAMKPRSIVEKIEYDYMAKVMARAV